MDSASYLGGLITGEGCFCFSVTRRRRRLYISPIFAMFMTDRDTVDFAADSLEKLGLPVYRQERPRATGRGQCGINIGGLKRCKRYCETLIPYLTGQKRRAAELVLEFIVSREGKIKGAPYSESELDLVRNLREVNGNTRGRKNPL
jgi:hypothetical protein